MKFYVAVTDNWVVDFGPECTIVQGDPRVEMDDAECEKAKV
jgi:hypothetical protein